MALRLMTLFLLLGAIVLVIAELDWTSSCSKCKCMWSNGKKTADCRNLHFSEIPPNLSNEVRDIDLSNNPLHELRNHVFNDAGLQNVHKLKFHNCSIAVVHSMAFANIQLLIELDLSNNAIVELDSMVFRDNTKLRIVLLSRNKLRTLGDNMFISMANLQRIHLDNNELSGLRDDVFEEGSPLSHLNLENNKLTFISPTFGDRLKRLGSLELAGNPWLCDCKLEPFRKLSILNNWNTKSIKCNAPERLRGRNWTDPSVIFACDPKIIEPSQNAVLEVDSSNYTIACKAEGEPRPSILWIANGRSVDVLRSPQKYFISSSNGFPYWDNLTIINISYRDRGEYKCVATNPGGSDERNVTLSLGGSDYIGGGTLSSTSMSNMMLLIILLCIGAILLLVVIMLLICCFCKRSVRNHHHPLSKENQRMGDMRVCNSSTDSEKAPLNHIVNPLPKPNRQQSVPTSVITGATEVSDAKKALIEDDSIYSDDTLNYDYNKYNKGKIQVESSKNGENHYPPDLLTFPPHRAANQISPAGSSASTVADTSKLLPHLHSPIHNTPPYDTSSFYRTLPYSRSHSPFTASHHGAPLPRVPRQGAYVTIPRRPRASWSSSEPPATPEVGEPLYDNLGLRTSATGASLMSLNKLPASPSSTDSPSSFNNALKGLRPPFPLMPLPQPCDTIIEHESAAAIPLVTSTLPRGASAQNHRALSPNLEALQLRGSWARSPTLTDHNDSRRDSTASLLPSTPAAAGGKANKIAKIPPRPPPKPKKKTATGPLFEDEGEDGTEV